MKKWILRVGLSQAVAWGSFAASLLILSLPLWIPSPLTLTVLTYFQGAK